MAEVSGIPGKSTGDGRNPISDVSELSTPVIGPMAVLACSVIFATSDMLSNVYGGADWLTLHLECLR